MSENGNSYSKTMRIDLLPVIDGTVGGEHRPRVGPGAATGRSPATALDPGETRTPYDQLLQSIYDGVIVAAMDGSVVEVNRRMIDFLGVTRDRALSMSLFDVLSGSAPSLILTLREHLANQSFAVIQAYCVRGDGSLFPAEIAVNDLSANGVQRLCFFVRDVTVRRQQEQMLWTEHNAIQNSGSGIGVAGLDGQIEYANPAMAAMWGSVAADELVGLNVRDLFADPVAADAMVSAVLAAQKTWVGHLRAKRKDGGEFEVQVSAGCNRLSEGDTAGLVLSFIDITDRMRADRAIRESERQRVMLESLGAACHHLGQPATVLMTNLELMHQATERNGHGAESINALVDSSLQAMNRIRRILHRLNSVNEYRTTVYVQADLLDVQSSPSHILDIETPPGV